MSTRMRLVASSTVLLTAVSLLGLTAPASADEVDDLIAKLERSADISSALAVEAGGYSLVSETRWSDGTTRRKTYRLLANSSTAFEEITQFPNGKRETSAYISDRAAKTWAEPRPAGAEAARAWKLLKARPDAWLVKAMTGTPVLPPSGGGSPNPIKVPTMNNGWDAGSHLRYHLPERDRFSYEDVEETSPGHIRYSLRGAEDYDVSVVLRPDGAVERLEVAAPAMKWTPTTVMTWDYSAPVVRQPTGSMAVRNVDYMRAVQAPKLRGQLERFALFAGIDVGSASPAKLYEEARSAVANWRGSKLFIPIKVTRIKWGARLAAVNPFTKERHACDLVADFPGSTGEPEVWCKSGTDSWKPVSMCVQTSTVAGCIWSGREGSRASRGKSWTYA